MHSSPEEFERDWGVDKLVRLPARTATAPIPEKDRDFLVQAGLPAMVRYFPGSTGGVITFCRLAAGLVPVMNEQTVGPPLPPEWSVYWIMGDEFFCNGSAWWCVHDSTGRVDRIDIEIEPPIKTANSSVARFASAILAASLWSARCNRTVGAWSSEVDRLMRELADLDPPSMNSNRNFWPMYLNFIRDEGPDFCTFEKGSRNEGELAFETGPW